MLDGIPQALPALALADKVLGKTEKLGLTDAFTPKVTLRHFINLHLCVGRCG